MPLKTFLPRAELMCSKEANFAFYPGFFFLKIYLDYFLADTLV